MVSLLTIATNASPCSTDCIGGYNVLPLRGRERLIFHASRFSCQVHSHVYRFTLHHVPPIASVATMFYPFGVGWRLIFMLHVFHAGSSSHVYRFTLHHVPPIASVATNVLPLRGRERLIFHASRFSCQVHSHVYRFTFHHCPLTAFPATQPLFHFSK